VDEQRTARRYQVWRGGRLALDVRGEPGVLVSVSAAPPPPGTPPATHPFATGTAFVAEHEGELGALLRDARDLDAFLAAVVRAGYQVDEVG
jgi:hypothetical protein